MVIEPGVGQLSFNFKLILFHNKVADKSKDICVRMTCVLTIFHNESTVKLVFIKKQSSFNMVQYFK